MPRLTSAAKLGATIKDVAINADAFSALYDSFTESYRRYRVPLDVSFRDIVPIAAGADRVTHLIHSYPAKLVVGMPVFFANCNQLSQCGDLVSDPFCGTGTVLLEALLAGRAACGADSNPLARLIARVKVTPINVRRARPVLKNLVRSFSARERHPFAPVVDIDRWYAPRTARAMGCLLANIRAIEDEPTREFFLVCFSACAKRLSFADPRLSVPVRRKDIENASFSASEVRELFGRTTENNLARVAQLDLPTTARFVGLRSDARKPFKADTAQQVRLVITSPPYLSAQKYIRASTLSLGWLGLAPTDRLRPLEGASIGREHLNAADRALGQRGLPAGAAAALERIRAKNPLRADITAVYLSEMAAALETTVASLQPGGHIVLVMGNNTVCGEPFHTSDHVATMLRCLGLRRELELVDSIRSRGLMTKRNVTAGVITQEHVHVFRKALA